jgi:hypothetical protein
VVSHTQSYSPFIDSIEAVRAPSKAAFGLLLEAYDYATGLCCDTRQFAVEIQAFHRAGITENTLRWLLFKGYVTHVVEKRQRTGKDRSFQELPSPSFREQSCFVLTPEGLAMAQNVSQEERARSFKPPHASPGEQCRVTEPLPRWNRDLGELSMGGIIVKRYSQSAPNQRAILDAFEEDNWRPRIDDPLRYGPDADPRQCLHDAIKNLNRNQIQRLILFRGDGTGEGVQWQRLGEKRQLTAPSLVLPQRFP